jgi:hypothetical protein
MQIYIAPLFRPSSDWCRRHTKTPKIIAQIVILNGAGFAAHLVFGRIGVIHVIGWIGKHHVGQLFAQQGLIAVDEGRIPTQDFMIPANPKIAQNADRVFGNFRSSVFIGQAFASSSHPVIHPAHLRQIPSSKIKILTFQRLQFLPQQIFIPACILGDFIIGDHQGAALHVSFKCFRRMREPA